ncbi:MAG: hypothetical protein JSV48_15830, partial [Bradyrhizobium sp.]
MNFIGLHSYPETKAEPTVWVGPAEDANHKGEVRASYPARYAHTLSNQWGLSPAKTSEYSAGAHQLFATDFHGPDVMDPADPEAKRPGTSNFIFNATGRMLNDAFKHA